MIKNFASLVRARPAFPLERSNNVFFELVSPLFHVIFLGDPYWDNFLRCKMSAASDALSVDMEENKGERMIVLGINASEYCHKIYPAMEVVHLLRRGALNLNVNLNLYPAMEMKGANWGWVEVNVMKMKEDLPAPHLVPILCQGEEVTHDSSKILKKLDKLFPQKPLLFPEGNQEVEALENEISEIGMAFTRYYGLIDEDGFRRSMGPRVMAVLPCFLQCWCIVDRIVSKPRTEKTAMIQRKLEDHKSAFGDAFGGVAPDVNDTQQVENENIITLTHI